MKAFFASAERVQALEAAAKAWAGTPFRHNSKVRGQGANCVLAIVGVLEDAGFKVPEFELVPTNWSRHQKESKMEQRIDGYPELFMSIFSTSYEAGKVNMQPGDLVGFKVGLCVHHLGLVLPEGRFFQCNESMGAAILSRAEPQFKKRLARAWRPME